MSSRQSGARNQSPLPRRLSHVEGVDSFLVDAQEAAAALTASQGPKGPQSGNTGPPDGLSSPPGLSRRPRAGTMPSTFHLDGRPDVLRRQLSGVSLSGNGGAGGGGTLSVGNSGTTSPNPELVGGTGGGVGRRSPFLATSGVGRANLTNPASSIDLVAAALRAGAPQTGDRQQRLRSGSLTNTLPSQGLSSPFASGVFAGSWTPRSSIAGGRIPEELRSIHSNDSFSSVGGDDAHIRTLDYLGLDDSPVQGSAPFSASHNQSFASLQNLRQGFQDSQQLSGRLRSNTVASFPRRDVLPQRRTSPYNVPSADNLRSVKEKLSEEDENLMDNEEYKYGRMSRKDSEASDSSRLFYSSHSSNMNSEAETGNGMISSTARPRASTINILDDSGQILSRRRAGTTSGITPRLLDVGMPSPSGALLAPSGGTTPTETRMNLDQSVPHPGGSRPITPETRDVTPPPQQPSRSLWIGNLDTSTSAQELMQVFAPYGPIESLRLLPEKECGFVNFVSVNDAVRAKEDVLNRLGGQILSKHPSMVRIGFGKADSAPTTPGRALEQSRVAASANNNTPEANLQTAPTRALWVGSIPSHTTPSELLKIFSPYGPIESARVLTHKNCGFVNFERLDDAVCSRKALNGREILGSDVGAVRIGFAKVPNKITPGLYSPGSILSSPPVSNDAPSTPLSAATYYALRQVRGASAVPMEQQMLSGTIENYRSNLLVGLMANDDVERKGFKPLPESAQSSQSLTGAEKDKADAANISSAPLPSITDMQLLMRDLSGDDPDVEAHVEAVKEFRPPVTYYTTIPAPQTEDSAPGKRFSVSDAPRLREIRKRLDSGTMSQGDIDGVATDLLEESVMLSSDYIGNTLIQKFFEKCSLAVKLKLLERVGPHLSSIGIHKNGTWAAQKIIDCASTPEEMALICQNIKPYSPPLLLDQFGNYVVQCTLRFGSPAADFVFDSMMDRCWEIGQGRFGARSMRTCLESPTISKLQIKRVAIAIILNSIPLATNPNGALLLTWLLDTSNLPGRYRLLAPRLAPHLSHLCTHKLASLTVLRLINQKTDPEAAQIILKGLFSSSPQVLEDILGDQVHGVTVIQKVLSSNYIEASEKQAISEKVKNVLLTLRIQQVPAYRKLVEDLGMPFSSGSGSTRTGSYTRSPTWPSPHSQASSNFSPYSGDYASLVGAMGQMQFTPNRGPPTGSPQSFSPAGLPPMGLPMGGSPIMAGSPLGRQTSPLPPASMVLPGMPGAPPYGANPLVQPNYNAMANPDLFNAPYNAMRGTTGDNTQNGLNGPYSGAPPAPGFPNASRSHSTPTAGFPHYFEGEPNLQRAQ